MESGDHCHRRRSHGNWRRSSHKRDTLTSTEIASDNVRILVRK